MKKNQPQSQPQPTYIIHGNWTSETLPDVYLTNDAYPRALWSSFPDHARIFTLPEAETLIEETWSDEAHGCLAVWEVNVTGRGWDKKVQFLSGPHKGKTFAATPPHWKGGDALALAKPKSKSTSRKEK